MKEDKGKAAQKKRAGMILEYRTGSWWMHSASKKKYQIFTVSIDEKTLKPVIVYGDMETCWTWNRPLEGGGNGWNDEVALEDGTKVARFVRTTSPREDQETRTSGA